MNETKNTTIGFRTTTELRSELEKLAAKEIRSLSKMIEILVAEAMETRKKSGKT